MVLAELGNSLLKGLGDVLTGFLMVIPGLVGALVVLLVGYLVGWVVYKALDKLFLAIKVDNYLIKKTNLSARVGQLRLGHVLAVIAKWYIFILFLAPAANLVELPALTNFLYTLSLWIPSLIAALLIVLFGILAADYVYNKILHARFKSAHFVASLTRIVIIIFIVLLALEQLGLDISLAHNSFLIILGGVMLAVGLALGLGFGLALKDTAKGSVAKWQKKL